MREKTIMLIFPPEPVRPSVCKHDLGCAISAARRDLRLTRKEFGDRIGRSMPRVQQYEMARRLEPNVIARIERGLDLEPGSLLALNPQRKRRPSDKKPDAAKWDER